MDESFMGFVVGVVLSFIIIGLLASITPNEIEKLQREAITIGVAEWVVVDETGKTEFRWIKPEEKKSE